MADARSDDEPLTRALEGVVALSMTLSLMERQGPCAFCGKTRAYGHCSACPLTRARRQLTALEQTLMEAF